MGIKNVLKKAYSKTGSAVSKMAALSPDEVEKVEKFREEYLNQMPDPMDENAVELTSRLLAASGVEIYNAYLPQLKELYVPIDKNAEYEGSFKSDYNIRYFEITKWVTDKKENNLEKLVNVYEVLSKEECNIALIFHRKVYKTEVYLAVVNTRNDSSNARTNGYRKRLEAAIRGNFPGSEFSKAKNGKIPFLDNDDEYSVAIASNVPTEKSEKFISQTIEKLLDGCIPSSYEQEYTLILLATPVNDVEQRKLRLSEIYSGLAPYASWSTDYRYEESNSTSSSATIGVNVGASAGIQNGQNNTVTNSEGQTTSQNSTTTDGSSETNTESKSTARTNSKTKTKGTSTSETDTAGGNAGFSIGQQGVASFNAGGSYSHAWQKAKNISNAVTSGKTNTVSNSIANQVSKSIANSLGKAVSKTASTAAGVFSSTNFGLNFGANFARSSSVTATIGKNEGITQNYTNYTIKHALELLEEQMKRYEQSTALGLWDFAAYILSEDFVMANNVAHSYVALTQGEKSYMTQASINMWRHDTEEDGAKEITEYLKELRHPVFGLNPNKMYEDETFAVYPSIVTPTTNLSGKELAYSLNFPQKSVVGLPVIECTAFARNIVTYEDDKGRKLNLGNVFHMNREEECPVQLSINSLASHTFVTGSTGAGKSNTIYRLLENCSNAGINFLVVEPAKGEYKHVFGNRDDVSVYGTNPEISPLLKINPFSFPKGIHVLEHLDRLVEIFNVCWPMYAAMPAVLKSSIEQSYQDCGWDLNTSKNKHGVEIYPTFKLVEDNVRTIIDSSEYDNENKGAYKGSLLTRLKSLTNGINGMIFVQNEINLEDLFDKNVIVDLSRVGSSETKSLLMGMLVLKLQEYRMAFANTMNSDLKHITVLEEAHNLLRKTSVSQNSESGNLAGKSVEMLANAIAEMRTYGEGFIIADQAPGLMDMSVIRNTNTKIIMRLPDQEDRILVGKAANLDDDQIKELAKLPLGVAAIYQNEWIQPVLCKVGKHENENGRYQFDNDQVSYQNSDYEISKALLDCILKKEIFKYGNKKELEALKEDILKSNLDADIKLDVIDYLESDEDFEALGSLLYKLLDIKNIMKKVKGHDDIDVVIKELDRKLKEQFSNSSNEIKELVFGIILYQQQVHDVASSDLYLDYMKKYGSNGGIF